jgi:tetratricopeptide (TPR) repeat protein
MTEEVLNRLFKIGDLRVISRTSSMKFKGAKLTAKEIASQLGVSNILEGSVQKSGNRVKISVQLIDATTDTQLWSESYEREFKDVFDIQSEIAQGVAKGLSATLSASAKSSFSAIPTKNIEAYNLYLKGMFEIQKVTPGSMEIGLKMMNQAIALDPDFALPYLGIAYYFAAATDFFLAPNMAMPELKIAVQTALAKDSISADAHGWNGFYDLWYAWDWDKARNELVKGIQLDDKKALCHWLYSWHLSSQGNFVEAIKESGRAVELEPMDAFVGAHHALMYYYHREYDRALRELDRVKAFESNQPFEHFIRGQVYCAMGNWEAAITEQQAAHQLFAAPWSHGRLAYAYAMAGKKQEALAILDLLEKQSGTDYVASDVVASVYVALGDYDHAFQFLEKGINERAAWMIWLNVDPIWDPIRKHIRFFNILEKMNLNK